MRSPLRFVEYGALLAFAVLVWLVLRRATFPGIHEWRHLVGAHQYGLIAAAMGLVVSVLVVRPLSAGTLSPRQRFLASACHVLCAWGVVMTVNVYGLFSLMDTSNTRDATAFTLLSLGLLVAGVTAALPGGHATPNRSCAKCGYALTGLKPGSACPECGTAPARD